MIFKKYEIRFTNKQFFNKYVDSTNNDFKKVLLVSTDKFGYWKFPIAFPMITPEKQPH